MEIKNYGMIGPTFWTGETGRRLRQNPKAQVMAAYLCTNGHCNALGLYYIPLLYAHHETGLSIEDTRSAIETLEEVGFCLYDRDTEIVWVKSIAAIRILQGKRFLLPKDNRVKSVAREYASIPRTWLLGPFFEHYGQALRLEENRAETEGLPPPPGAEKGPAGGKNTPSTPLQSPLVRCDNTPSEGSSETPSKGLARGSEGDAEAPPKQEQEQEQEEYIKNIPARTPSRAPSGGKRSGTDQSGGRYYLTAKGRKLNGWKLEAFEQFWKAFAYPEDKAKCADVWLKIPGLNPELVETAILPAAAAEAANRQKTRDAGLTPIYPQGWLSGRRWETWLERQQRGMAAPTEAEPWYESWSGIVRTGEQLGLKQGDGEPPPRFVIRVFRAAMAKGYAIPEKTLREAGIRPAEATG